MRGIIAVYRKEMGHYFVSPIAYIVVGLFLALCALFFNTMVSGVILQSAEQQMQGMSSGIDMPGLVYRAFFELLSTLLLFFTPMLTMGIYAEERKRGTMELLMTSPITEMEIVLGKFLAAVSLLAAMLLPNFAAMMYVWNFSDPHPAIRIILTGFLGVFLLGGSLLGLGSFCSSLTENQLIAAVLGFAGTLLVWIINQVAVGATGIVSTILQYLSVIYHFDDFSRGVIDTSSLIFYLSFIFFFVFLTVRSVDSLRWRRA